MIQLERNFVELVVLPYLPLMHIERTEDGMFTYQKCSTAYSEYEKRYDILEEFLFHGERVASLLDFYFQQYPDELSKLPKVAFVRDFYLYGAILHDIGKAYSTRDPLDWHKRKNDLTESDWQQMRNHIFATKEIFKLFETSSNFALPNLVHDMALLHHEFLDGSGYIGLAGDEIPFHVRLLTIADQLVGRLEDRPYRDEDEKFTLASALIDMEEIGNDKFDPLIFKNFSDLLKNSAHIQNESLKWLGEWQEGKL